MPSKMPHQELPMSAVPTSPRQGLLALFLCACLAVGYLAVGYLPSVIWPSDTEAWRKHNNLTQTHPRSPHPLHQVTTRLQRMTSWAVSLRTYCKLTSRRLTSR